MAAVVTASTRLGCRERMAAVAGRHRPGGGGLGQQGFAGRCEFRPTGAMLAPGAPATRSRPGTVTSIPLLQ